MQPRTSRLKLRSVQPRVSSGGSPATSVSSRGGSTGASGTERFDAPLGNADDWRSTEGGTQAKASSDPQAQTPPSNVYDEAIVAAVKRFQKRHGLISDGIAGPNTVYICLL